MADPQYVKDFIREMTPYAVAVGDQYGIDPVTIITQAAIETGWGQEVAGNNFFGIKSHGRPGGQNITTHEEINGQRVKTTDSFRTYNNLGESVADYGRFLSENPRYAAAIAQEGRDELNGITAAGYATDSKYPKLVNGVGNMVQRNIQPLPPGSLPEVGTFLDTVRMPPQPATQSGSVAFRRANTSPLGDNTALPGALAQYATTQANRVTPAIRRPELPSMGTPDVGALYNGIYPQQPRAAVPQSQIDRGAVRIPPTQGNLTNPGAIDASVGGLSQSPALQAALSRSINRPSPVPQSQIERTQLPIGQSQIERTALPRNVPPDLVSQSMQRIASANPTRLPTIPQSTIGQPPSTRSVQSVPMPAINTQGPSRVTISTPNTVPQRMVGQDTGNVARQLPSPTTFTPEQRYTEPRNTAPQNYIGPFVPDKGLERLATPSALSFNPIQQPAFTTQIRSVQIPNPAWSATPAAVPAGTPMSGGLSRDAVALRATGTNAAQSMANIPRMVTVQQNVRVPSPQPVQRSPLRVSVVGAQTRPVAVPQTRMQQGLAAFPALNLTNAQVYAALNSGIGSINNSDAANRVNGSNTRGSGGANSISG